MAAKNMFAVVILAALSVVADASGNETDRLALVKFKQGITSDPNGVFKSWNDSLPFCGWFGVTCSRRHLRVTSLFIRGQKLVGTISPFIGNLSFLRTFDLTFNNFHGHIPQEFGNLFRLRLLGVGNNSISGEVPGNLSLCHQLKEIYFTNNRIEGTIPSNLGGLTRLMTLALAQNNIGGQIPPSLANLSSLTLFQVTRNNLVGNIPADMARLRSLTLLAVGGNYLSGRIHPTIFNMSALEIFETANNRFDGTLPDSIGLTLPNLKQFFFSSNEFVGLVPSSLPNASYLQAFELDSNNFEGQVPNIGNHPDLVGLSLSDNNLGFNSSEDLMFLESLKNSTSLGYLVLFLNKFGGLLPYSIGNLSVSLNTLYLGGNQFTGPIPTSFEKFVNLKLLDLQLNLLTGVIPSCFGNLRRLSRLTLQGNRLSGQIPSSLGNLTRLSRIDLSKNQLNGSIPSSIGNCTLLNTFSVSQNNLEGLIPQELAQLSSLSVLLDLSHNSLSGNLPEQVGKLINVNSLDVSENKLSGEIPESIGACLALESLYMQGNSFGGVIPASLASLRGLQHIDLSRNNLTGNIPEGLQYLSLQLLNLSYNDLEGAVPTQGVFRNTTALSMTGNTKLCGGILQLLLPKCPAKNTKKGMSLTLKIVIAAICVAFSVLLVLASFFTYQRRKSIVSPAVPSSMDHYVRVSYQDLHNATSGFSPENLIGSGNFGYVYKGYLNQAKKKVAIKVLQLQQRHAFRTLMAECNVLKNVRHRNLVKLLSYCSSLDYKGNEFKALIFEFMENGNLDEWLHHDSTTNNESVNSLNFLQRINIAIDVASALHYLHDLYEGSIIHCDLKPSNVLLDEDMVAHVTDFGLARFLLTNNDASRSQTSSAGIQGTVGYVAPEYAMGSPMSREGDAYSFGILVLEMFSGKRPTDLMFKDSLNLHNFVRNALPEGIMQVVDQRLITGEKTSNRRTNEAQSIVSVMEVGIGCSMDLPQERTRIGDAAKQLHFIRSSFLGVCET